MDNTDLLKDDKGNNFIDINSRSTWIEFFFIFSRFEYALKRTGYVSPNTKYAEANWKEFGEKIESEFNKHECQALIEAKKYLLENPPKRQVVKDGTLAWSDLDYRDHQDKEILRLICAIKQVRNNLFHGGKFPEVPMEDPSRNQELIKHSMTVLKYLLFSSPDIKSKYFEPL